jgi:hypothetical protein
VVIHFLAYRIRRREDEAVKWPTTPNPASPPISYSRGIGCIRRVAEGLQYGIEEFLEVKYLARAALTGEVYRPATL